MANHRIQVFHKAQIFTIKCKIKECVFAIGCVAWDPVYLLKELHLLGFNFYICSPRRISVVPMQFVGVGFYLGKIGLYAPPMQHARQFQNGREQMLVILFILA